jgi:archaellum component FlaF (FlaF/FlaG flagellin family)
MRYRNVYQSFSLFLTLVLAMSCSKKNEEIAPSTSTLMGKWKHKESVGKLTFTSNGKTKIVDLNDTNDGSVIEFKSDGNAIFEGEAVKYTITGKAVVLNYGTGKPTIDFTVSKLTSAEMTTSYTLDQCFKYIERYYDTTDPDIRELIKNKATATLTEYTVTYSK